MNATLNDAARPVTPEQRGLRRARILRSLALLAIGFVIAFSAPMHADLQFDRWVLFAGLLAIGATTIAEFLAIRSTPASWLVATRATVALVAAAAVLTSRSALDVAIVLSVWSASSVVIAVWRVSRGSQARTVAVPSALLSGLLAVLILIFREDLVAIIGFFGAYAILRGVFLGISAFDSRAAAAALGEDDETGDDEFAPAN